MLTNIELWFCWKRITQRCLQKDQHVFFRPVACRTSTQASADRFQISDCYSCSYWSIFSDFVCQRGTTGGTKATSDPRPPVTRPAINLLTVTTSFVVCSPEDLKKIPSADYIQIRHMIHYLKIHKVKSCARKFKIICNSIVMCAYFNKMNTIRFGLRSL